MGGSRFSTQPGGEFCKDMFVLKVFKKKKSFRIQKYISSYIFISLNENKSSLTKEYHINFWSHFRVG